MNPCFGRLINGIYKYICHYLMVTMILCATDNMCGVDLLDFNIGMGTYIIFLDFLKWTR